MCSNWATSKRLKKQPGQRSSSLLMTNFAGCPHSVQQTGSSCRNNSVPGGNFSTSTWR